MSFTGEYSHTIDAKGRLIVPARLRDELEDGIVMLTPWMERCIAMWSIARFREQIEDKLLAERNSDANKRRITRTLSATAHQDKVDSQGRIGVPAHLRDFAGIDRDVTVIGAMDHAEIWEPARWADEKASAEDDFEAIARELNF